ncbi:hypothetical protein C6A85_63950, partial [Mycobacterium sp. ITM-2017-0098]
STATEDAMATPVAEALTRRGAHCTTMSWAPDADHTTNADALAKLLRERQVTGLVILTGPPTGDAEDHVPLHARDCAQHLVRITRDVP